MIRHPRCARGIALLVSLLFPTTLLAQRPLDHDAWARWRSIAQEVLSRDGRWVSYVLEPQEGDAELIVRAVAGPTEYRVPRGGDARFAPDGTHLVFMIRAEHAQVRAARIAGRRGDDLPRDSLGILTLATGAVTRFERVRSFRVPEQSGPWTAWTLERSRTPGAPRDTVERAVPDTGPRPRREAGLGYPLVLRNLVTGDERRYDDVTEYTFTRDGARLALAITSRLGETDGVVTVELGAAVADRRLADGRGTYRGLAFDENGSQLAFVTTRDEADAEHPRYALYRWAAGDSMARAVAAAGTAGLPAGWTVSEHRSPSFSRSGGRLYFGTVPWVPPAPTDSTPDNERVQVDIWHWQDAELQPMQLRRLEQARRQNYLAVVHLPADRVVQLGDTALASVELPSGGDGRYGIGTDDRAYRIRISWDTPSWQDVYTVDLETGQRTLLLEETQARPSLSPGGTYAYWYDRTAGGGLVHRFDGGGTTTVTGGIPHPLVNEEHDAPSPPSPYGVAGWTEGDRDLLLYDRYDVWAIDPAGVRAPRNVTEGAGRRDSMRLRIITLDREAPAIRRDEPILLSAFNYRTKQAGFFRDRVAGTRAPEQLVLLDRRFSTPVKAAAADVLLFTRESFQEFPDLWSAGLDLSRPVRLSDANPQQAEYRWATVEPVHWRGADGTPLAGLLYKPADFDPARRYPLIVNFYERNSDNLHAHSPVVPHRSTIRPSFYASRGYLVFIPDVVYRVGYPGQSALDAVVPGVLELLGRGFVDPARIGTQGHSWGGYQISYMVTKTNLFRAAAAGAPVANMTSAYGGIRWESGMSRMFQYERTQSRIGATLWEAPLQYLENSPLFWADRIATPLLVLHNDQDGAVPWYQGIELFTALRRLAKPVWLVNYNGEPHWPLPYRKRLDWNIRMQQFFDHYLMDAPMPVWMARGIPAMDKGRTLGLDPVDEVTLPPR